MAKKSLMVPGKGTQMATFNIPAYGQKNNTQKQSDFNSYKAKKVPNQYQSKKINIPKA